MELVLFLGSTSLGELEIRPLRPGVVGMLALLRRILALSTAVALMAVLADTGAPTLLARVALPTMLTDAAASALLAPAGLPAVFARLGWHPLVALSTDTVMVMEQ